jgi:hypothetical protein
MEIAATFTKLVRYKQGLQTYYGDLLESNVGGHRVARLEKTATGTFRRVGQEDVVDKVSVCPVPPRN